MNKGPVFLICSVLHMNTFRVLLKSHAHHKLEMGSDKKVDS